MATCTQTEIRVVTLELTLDEAEAVHGLLGELTATPTSTSDKAFERVFRALDESGVSSRELIVDGWTDEMPGVATRWAE